MSFNIYKNTTIQTGTFVANSSATALVYASTVTGASQPYACSTTQLNTNLNADYVDGLHSTSFLGTVTTGAISATTPLSVTAGRQALSGALAISIDTANLVPYVGATSSLNMGVYDITVTTGNIETLKVDHIIEKSALHNIVLGSNTVTTSLTASSNLICNGTFASNGTTNIGDASSDQVVFISEVSSNFIPSTDSVYDLGGGIGSKYWNAVYADEVFYNATAKINGDTAGELDHTGDVSIQNDTTISFAGWDYRTVAVATATLVGDGAVRLTTISVPGSGTVLYYFPIPWDLFGKNVRLTAGQYDYALGSGDVISHRLFIYNAVDGTSTNITTGGPFSSGTSQSFGGLPYTLASGESNAALGLLLTLADASGVLGTLLQGITLSFDND